MDSTVSLRPIHPASPRRIPAWGLRYWLARTRALGVFVLAAIDGPTLFDRLPATAWYEEMSSQILQALDPGSSDHLLDLGCGAGRQAIKAARLVKRVMAVDHASAMLARAARNRTLAGADNVEIRWEDAEALSFRDRSFDLATGFMLLPSFKDPSKAISELVRVVRPGGRIGLLVPSESLTPRAAWRFADTHGLGGFDQDSLLAWAHTSRRFSEPELLRLLTPHSDQNPRMIPLLDGMALAAILTKPGRCTGL